MYKMESIFTLANLTKPVSAQSLKLGSCTRTKTTIIYLLYWNGKCLKWTYILLFCVKCKIINNIFLLWLLQQNYQLACFYYFLKIWHCLGVLMWILWIKYRPVGKWLPICLLVLHPYGTLLAMNSFVKLKLFFKAKT